jgi:hypothetical protein
MTAPPPTSTGHDARRRDRHRLAATATTGVVAVAAISATGAVAGHLAREQAQQDAAARAQQTRAERPQPRLRERPTRVRVTTRYVSAATGEVVDRDAAVRTTPAPVAAPDPVPAPEPPPAPTSGS